MTGCGTTTSRNDLPELRTVPQVDLTRYVGTWYEIASFPQPFQRGCTGTTATYTLQPDGRIEVLNRCRKNSLDGKREMSAAGRARGCGSHHQRKTQGQLFRPFWGDYWIIDLGPDYEYAVVGHPSRDYLWILSRTPRMDGTLYDAILARLREQGYEVGRLNRTLQPQPPVQGP